MQYYCFAFILRDLPRIIFANSKFCVCVLNINAILPFRIYYARIIFAISKFCVCDLNIKAILLFRIYFTRFTANYFCDLQILRLCFKYKCNITVSRLLCAIYRELFLRFPNFAFVI